jgi:hypothetical protein
MNRTLVLAVAVAGVLGLAAGAGAGYLTRTTASNAAPAAAAAGQATTGGQAGTAGQAAAASQDGGATRAAVGGGGQAGGRQPTSGTVEQVDAGKLTVRTESGTVDVPLSDETVVRKLVKATASELKVGDVVFGRGSADAQGALRLSTLQIMPAGEAAAGPGGGGGRAGQGGASGQGGQAQGGAAGGQGQSGGRQGGFGRGQADGQGQGGRGVAGTIAKIDGATLVVTTPGGDVTATLAEDAEVRRLTTAGRDEIKPGQAVTVVGAPDGGSARARMVVTITV